MKATRSRKKTNRHLKKRPGKPQFVPTKEQRFAVESMAGCLRPYEEIAACTMNPHTGRGISTSTLQRVFRQELDAGRGVMARSCSVSLRKQIESGNVTAIIWAQKNLHMWADRQQHAHALMSVRNPERNEVELLVAFGKDGEPATLDLDAFAAQSQQPQTAPMRNAPQLEDLRPRVVSQSIQEKQAELDKVNAEIERLRGILGNREEDWLTDLPVEPDGLSWPGRTRSR